MLRLAQEKSRELGIAIRGILQAVPFFLLSCFLSFLLSF
jgi:hypothetical protein